jgi:translation initiation factor 2B subunit (eIF-2B alpha/beta/delta family)
VDVIITEFGVIPPQAAYSLIKEKFGWRLENGNESF